jgi:hypothetical protein
MQAQHAFQRKICADKAGLNGFRMALIGQVLQW